MNLSDSNQLSNFYEQMLIQRNLVVQQQLRQNDSLQLQILNKSNSSSSSASSTSSLLSISSKSQQPSPNNSLISDKSESPESKSKANEFEPVYPNYMFNTFPYSFLANFGSNLSPIAAQPKSLSSHQHVIQTTSHTKQTSSSAANHASHHHHHHYHHSNQNIYRPNGKSEEAKPTHSYIGLIALAILSAPEKKLVLSDIYQWILENYSYFHSRGSGWRNSIRHNLSLNDCFMKSGRSSNGKGHYWTIHPANMDDFMKGDFRRRRAQRRVRKSLGLTVPEEDEEDDELLTPPSSLSPVQKFNNFAYAANSLVLNGQFANDKNKMNFYNFQSDYKHTKRLGEEQQAHIVGAKKSKIMESDSESVSDGSHQSEEIDIVNSNSNYCEKEEKTSTKKRSFNMDSLLAPEENHKKIKTEYLETENELNRAWQLSTSIKPINVETHVLDAAKSKAVKSDQISTIASVNKGESNNEDVQQWKLTFSKIMARSYKNNSNQTNHLISGFVKK